MTKYRITGTYVDDIEDRDPRHAVGTFRARLGHTRGVVIHSVEELVPQPPLTRQVPMSEWADEGLAEAPEEVAASPGLCTRQRDGVACGRPSDDPIHPNAVGRMPSGGHVFRTDGR